MNCFNGIRNKRFCVIGDLIVDHYRVLKEKRLSQEAPVVVFHPDHDEYRLGGSANVANNIHSMGGCVELVTGVGNDWDDIYEKLYMPFKPICITFEDRRTTIKERLITKRQQIARIDIQDWHSISENDAKAMVGAIAFPYDAIVISDYDHGIVHEYTCKDTIERAIDANIPVVVNSKAKETMRKYKGATVLILNHNEARDITGMNDCSLVTKIMIKEMGLKAVIITLGANGMLLGTDSGRSEPHIRSFPPLDCGDDEVIDVTGAGDTVTAAVAVGITLGIPYDGIIRLANVAAGIVIKKLGTATVSLNEIEEVITDRDIKI